jgi:hypothetical protein
MSMKPLDVVGGANGGPVRITTNPQRKRHVHITVSNPTNATHAAFFGRSRRELSGTDAIVQSGFAIVCPPNTVANQTVNGVSYQSFVLEDWTGELWAVADIGGGIIKVEVIDGASEEL